MRHRNGVFSATRIQRESTQPCHSPGKRQNKGLLVGSELFWFVAYVEKMVMVVCILKSVWFAVVHTASNAPDPI